MLFATPPIARWVAARVRDGEDHTVGVVLSSDKSRRTGIPSLEPVEICQRQVRLTLDRQRSVVLPH